jgi:TolA-binding protein
MRYTLPLIVLLASIAGWSVSLDAAQRYSNKEIKTSIEKEQQALQDIEKQISELSSVAARKAAIKDMLSRGDQAGIQRWFDEDAARVEAALQANDLPRASEELVGLKAIYQIVPAMAGNLLYYDGALQYQAGRVEMSRSTMQEVVENHVDCTRFSQALMRLEQIHFLDGRNQELVDCYQKYPQMQTYESLFWVANAFYDLDNYDEASRLFTSLVGKGDFGFRSESMLAMITFARNGTEAAITQFRTLQQKYPQSSPFYGFTYLSLARLFQVKGDYRTALDLYEQYHQASTSEMTDELRFEMILLYLKIGEKDKAVAYLNEVLDHPQSYEYYTSANYLLALVYQEAGNLDNAESSIANAISQSNQVIDILNSKQQLLMKQRDLLRQYQEESDPVKRDQILQKIRVVNDAIANTTVTLDKVSGSLSARELDVLKSTEADYLLQEQKIAAMQTRIDSLNVTSNHDVEKFIDNSLNDLSDSEIMLRALSYVCNLHEVTEDDYSFATQLSIEISETKQVIDIWSRVAELTRQKGRTELAARCEAMADESRDDLAALNAMAYGVFGEINENNPAEKELREEEEVSKNLIDNLSGMRGDLGLRYNQAIARQMNSSLQIILTDQQRLRQAYNELLTGIQDKMDIVNQKYDYTLINIMYNRAMELDKQYDALQHQ